MCLHLRVVSPRPTTGLSDGIVKLIWPNSRMSRGREGSCLIIELLVIVICDVPPPLTSVPAFRSTGITIDFRFPW
jgi:hypothetical protein